MYLRLFMYVSKTLFMQKIYMCDTIYVCEINDLLDEKMTKTKVVDSDEFYNFGIHGCLS